LKKNAKISPTLWIKYYRDGRAFRESTHTSKLTLARKILDDRLRAVRENVLIEPMNRRIQMEELYRWLLRDYEVNERASLDSAQRRWRKRLKLKFDMLAVNVRREDLDNYITWCREQGLSNATINRDMAALKRAFHLALDAGKMERIPKFPKNLPEKNRRKGFVEEQAYRTLAAHAKQLWLRALLAVGYAFGFRKSELLGLRVGQVDLLHRIINLEAFETKNDEARKAPMTDEVYLLLQACVEGKKPNDFVFTRENGGGVKNFREAWESLCCRAGLGQQVCSICTEDESGRPQYFTMDEDGKCPSCKKRYRAKELKYVGLYVHDLRRSAVRNMVRRGVPEVVAMRISGHKTRSVFDRYNIVSEADLRDAARKIQAGSEYGQDSGRIGPETSTSTNENATARARSMRAN
jgi:integrase